MLSSHQIWPPLSVVQFDPRQRTTHFTIIGRSVFTENKKQNARENQFYYCIPLYHISKHSILLAEVIANAEGCPTFPTEA